MRYSDTILVIPPDVVPYLSLYDGEQESHPALEHLTQALSNSGFLHNNAFERLQSEKHREFAAATVRLPSHAGSAYPEDLRDLREQMNLWMGSEGPVDTRERKLIGIAAPHVSPSGGYQSYRAAYRLLTPEYRDRTFVVLGTSHYGEPDRLGLIRKPYVTPFGTTQTAPELLERLAPGIDEDYCHSVEHSIEFQVLFLQSIYGPDIRVLPILCGSYARSIYRGGMPEENDDVKRTLDALGEIHAREGEKIFWILGIDMAHMGRRYGDELTARADEGAMSIVAARDRARIERIDSGDAAGFWDLVQQNQDDLKWCGSAPVYTFLRAVPEARATLERYEQWNIDAGSVVTFAGMSFAAAQGSDK